MYLCYHSGNTSMHSIYLKVEYSKSDTKWCVSRVSKHELDYIAHGTATQTVRRCGPPHAVLFLLGAVLADFGAAIMFSHFGALVRRDWICLPEGEGGGAV